MKLADEVRQVKSSEAGAMIAARMEEFRSLRGEGALFAELCFCLMAANFTSERSWRIQREIGRGFLSLPEAGLAGRLRELGHRFPNARARYIVGARAHAGRLGQVLSGPEPRRWLVENVRGLGLKEASHFLRNTGHEGYAIVDFHIVDLLSRHGLIEKPRTMTPSRYLEIENVLAGIAAEAGATQGELDMYLWYIETGKILK